MFNAKVKADGRLFVGYIENGTSIEVHALETNKEYFGLVFDSGPTHTPYIEYEGSTFASFKSEELESAPEDLCLIQIDRRV
jgi:hypothetical protein